MKISKFALTAMIASACLGGTAFGQSNRTAPRYYPASYYSYQDGASTQAPAPITSASDSTTGTTASVSCDNTPACDVAAICDGKSSCDSLGCGSTSVGCGLGAGGLFGDCCLGDPWKLFPCPVAGFNIGGWTSVGYHSARNPNSFNTYDSRVQLGQQWLFAEKIADGSEGLGLGGRIDYVYGTDAPDTQAFGTPGFWDTGWDNGTQYGHAIPQLYGEVASGDLSVKLGHFFTIVGNEVVQSTGNFFYSRQFTFYNAEPFTHSGALATYNLDDETQLYAGYVMGWDSAFDDNGDTYLSGFKRKLSDDVSFLYTSALGRFGDRTAARERGGVHSAILTANLTDNLTFINQSDVLFSRDLTGAAQRNTFGNISYLLYKVNDCVSLGQRFEWFNYGGAGFGGAENNDLYNYTLGVNYKQSANLMFRPEVRWVWDKDRFGFNEDNAGSQAAFGGDMVFTF
ncbi:MAG: outer membrane beta-barrel protein [Pirellula sp.]|jgi:hypothetical protein|nr:porin [Pirellula sp.]